MTKPKRRPDERPRKISQAQSPERFPHIELLAENAAKLTRTAKARRYHVQEKANVCKANMFA